VVGIGLGIVLVPLLVGWASANQFQATPLDVWQLAVQVWALGHGVPLHVDLTGAGSVIPSELAVFDITLALLGCALVTFLLAVRAGRRIADTEDSLIVGAMLVAFVAFLVGSVLWTGQSSFVNVEVTFGTLKILVPFVIGLCIGWKPWRLWTGENAIRDLLPEDWRDVIVTAGRVTIAAFLALVVVASVVLTVSIVAGFATEAGQIIALPTVIVWTMSWLIGPGFSIGLGTLVSPFSATVGAFPAIPLLGAIPADSVVVGWPILAVPVLVVGIVAGVLSPGIVRRAGYFDPTGATDFIRLGALGLMTSVFSGVLFFVVGAFASGSAGPGRFVFVGVDPADVAFSWAAIALGGTLLGSIVRLVRPLPRDVARSVDMRTR